MTSDPELAVDSSVLYDGYVHAFCGAFFVIVGLAEGRAGRVGAPNETIDTCLVDFLTRRRRPRQLVDLQRSSERGSTLNGERGHGGPWTLCLQSAASGGGLLLRVEAPRRDRLEVGAGDAHELRPVGEADGVDLADLESTGHARLEAEGAILLQLSFGVILAVIEARPQRHESGRASCRERVCQYV